MSDADGTSLRTLVIGIAGACPTVLQPLFEAGELPTLRSVFDAGVAGALTSRGPPWSASAGPTMYTGVNPGKHGIFDFLRFEGYDWDLVDASDIRAPTIWERLDGNGITSVIVNAPVTHPAQAIDGAVLPGHVLSDDPRGYPDGIVDEVREHLGAYSVYDPQLTPDKTVEETVAHLQWLTRSRGDAFRYLAERFDPEFGLLYFQQTNTTFHEFPGNRRQARRVYRAVDDTIAHVLRTCRPDTVMVVSGHGSGAYDRRFRMNVYLAEHGYVESTRRGNGTPMWTPIHGPTNNRDPLAQRIGELAARLGLTSQRIAAALERVGLREVVEFAAPDTVIRAASEQVDFSTSTAYMRSKGEYGVRINLSGRDPDGVVSPEEYHTIRLELIDLLSTVTTPRGDPVFETVAPAEEFYEGPYIDEAVDIVTIPTNFDTYVTPWLTGSRFETPNRRAWDHTDTGIIAGCGTDIDPDGSIAGANLVDVAPTVLATLGVRPPDEMDGGPLDIVATEVAGAGQPHRPSATGIVEETVPLASEER